MFPGRIPESEITIEFTRSSGPGGQNVNKTATKAQLKWSPSMSAVFSDTEKSFILDRLGRYLTADGFLALSASSQRSQLQNRQAVVDRLQRLVAHALMPKKKRVPTRPTKASKERRLASKKIQSEKKALRKVL
jgi:ribosome-associated protein